jgi:hypothetical protein
MIKAALAGAAKAASASAVKARRQLCGMVAILVRM